MAAGAAWGPPAAVLHLCPCYCFTSGAGARQEMATEEMAWSHPFCKGTGAGLGPQSFHL